jgi:hypothetical protein
MLGPVCVEVVVCDCPHIYVWVERLEINSMILSSVMMLAGMVYRCKCSVTVPSSFQLVKLSVIG